ncbi:MAG: T9SS type A sorting domain-containing protein, partial [Bacteroidia bacterium]
DDFNPVIRHLEAPAPGTKSTRAYLEMVKQNMPSKKYNVGTTANKKSAPPTPYILNGFRANPYKGIPNDNSLAISNDGMIISCINSTLHVYNANGDLLQGASLNAIGKELGIDAHKFDPRVIYDPQADRFVLTYLNGASVSTSQLTVAFSKTNDPTEGWNLYALPGNPLNDSSWSDYPMISITENEVFYTINLLRTRVGNEDWRQTFKQTVIWQIDKNDGYNGNEINTKLWSDVNFGNKPIRNLHPVKGGSDVYGPNMYFLSTRNFDVTNDTIFFLEITNEIDNSPELKIDYLISDVAYGLAPNANQNKTILELQTNDARVLDAFLEQDQIVFAANSIDTSNNFAAVYFGHINNVGTNPSLKGTIYGSDSLEFGYPGLAFVGDDSNFEAIMCMNHSSISHYPGCGVAFYNGSSFSNYKYVKEGVANIQLIGDPERWGDYIGMQPKFNELGICWMAGTFGKESQTVGTEYGTWVAEIQKYGYNSINPVANKSIQSMYPNPANIAQWITFKFNLNQEQSITYSIYNTNGQLVSTLYKNAPTKAGINEFNFDSSPLNTGSYLLKLSGNNGFSTVHQFIVK